MLGDSKGQIPTSGVPGADMAIGEGGGGGNGDGANDHLCHDLQEEKSSSSNSPSRVVVDHEEDVVIDNKLNNNYGANNRWPRQETLALLKIRSDMDQVFRDSSHKAPLWHEVSRKLGELGYNRSAKKCKEKFENVYKYNRRTKEIRTKKSEGKIYKFFDQLQSLENNSSYNNLLQPPTQPQNPISTNITTLSFSTTNNEINPSNNVNHIIASTNIPPPKNPINFMSITSTNPMTLPTSTTTPPTHKSRHKNLFSSSTSSSSTDSDEELDRGRRKRKQKWKAFFAKLTNDVMRKQEELQAKFLETVERHERERMVREESWRVQEMARITREHEILLQERSASTAKDNALVAFLQKVSAQGVQFGNHQPPSLSLPQSPQQPPPSQDLPPLQQPTQPRQPPPPPQPILSSPASLTNMDMNIVKRSENNNHVEKNSQVFKIMSSSNRWPKAEVQALISIRTSLDLKYQESYNNGEKGTLWEEVSLGMQKLEYNRNAKKCKEKWENINKYFKRVKDSNKKRGEDSKTCPYFHQLDALYKEKNIESHHVKHIGINLEPLMVRPEQQWPPPPQEENNMNQSFDEGEEEDEIYDEENEEVEEGCGGGFEVVVNKPS